MPEETRVNAYTKRAESPAQPTATMTASVPLVSVVIPSFNSAHTLGQTLDSVLAQQYPHIETIVVDDGSTDATETVVRQYGDRVCYIRQANGGLASARNAGLTQTRGAYVALLDADDLCEPERIGLQVACMETYHDVVLCSSDFSAFDAHGEIARSYINKYYGMVARAAGGIGSLFPDRAVLDATSVPALASYVRTPVTVLSAHVYDALVGGNFIHPPTVLFRQALLDRVGEFDERVRSMCDYDWFIRVSRVGKLGYIDRPLLRYRLSESQMSGDRHRPQIMLDLIQVVEKLRRADPALSRRRRSEFRRRIGHCYLSVADALADTRKGAAVMHLLRSMRYCVVRPKTGKVAVKVLTPQALINLYRCWR